MWFLGMRVICYDAGYFAAYHTACCIPMHSGPCCVCVVSLRLLWVGEMGPLIFVTCEHFISAHACTMRVKQLYMQLGICIAVTCSHSCFAKLCKAYIIIFHFYSHFEIFLLGERRVAERFEKEKISIPIFFHCFFVFSFFIWVTYRIQTNNVWIYIVHCIAVSAYELCFKISAVGASFKVIKISLSEWLHFLCSLHIHGMPLIWACAHVYSGVIMP